MRTWPVTIDDIDPTVAGWPCSEAAGERKGREHERGP
jgi:hypothetical protein